MKIWNYKVCWKDIAEANKIKAIMEGIGAGLCIAMNLKWKTMMIMMMIIMILLLFIILFMYLFMKLSTDIFYSWTIIEFTNAFQALSMQLNPLLYAVDIVTTYHVIKPEAEFCSHGFQKMAKKACWGCLIDKINR